MESPALMGKLGTLRPSTHGFAHTTVFLQCLHSLPTVNIRRHHIKNQDINFS